MNLVEIFEKEQIKQKAPQINPGDKVEVNQKIKEGEKTRTQSFEGIIIRTRSMKTARANFTVRKIASGVGVEKTFFVHSPNIIKIKILKKGKVRRAKLYYIRERQGKAAKVKEKEGELSEWKVTNAKDTKDFAKTQKEEVVTAKTQKPTKTQKKEKTVTTKVQKETKSSPSADITSKNKQKRKEKS